MSKMFKRNLALAYTLVLAMLISTLALGAEVRKLGEYDLSWGPYGATWTSPGGKSVHYLPRYFSPYAFSDNLTLFGNDVITRGPKVDVLSFADGLSGRPTLAAWKADMANTDMTAVIQAAIDNALQSRKAIVWFHDGWYKTTGPIHAGYGEAYRTIKLIGTHPMYGSPVTPGAWSGVVVDARSFTNAPAIVIQGGRMSGVRNLSILGAIRTNGSAPTAAYETAIHTNTVSYDNISTASNWAFGLVSANGMTRYAPYAGIAIDPYSGTAPATAYPTVTYPSWTGIGATQYGKNPSTRTTIENVEIFGFYVGVANQPSDYDGNGDYTTIKNSMIDGCAYGVSVGNANSRNFSIQDTQFGAINGMHTVLTGDLNGKQTGYFGGPMINLSVRRAFQIFSLNLAMAGPMLFEDLYSEGGVVRLGYLGTTGSVMNTITFKNSRIVTIGYSNALAPGADGFNSCIYNAPWFEGYGNINWDSSSAYSNCTFASMTRRLHEPVNLVSSNLYSAAYYTTDNNWKLAHNYFLGGVGVISARAEFSGTSWTPVFTTGMPTASPVFSEPKTSDTISGREPIHRYAKWYKNAYGPTVAIQNRNLYRDFTFTGMSPAFDNSTLVLTFTYPSSLQNNNDYRIEPGCVLWHEGSEALFVVDTVSADASPAISATMLTNYYYTGASTRAPVTAVALTGLLSLYQTFHKGSTFQWRGNVATASDNVTSMTCSAAGDSACGSASDVFKVGDLVWNSPYNFDNHMAAGAKVIAAGSNWIQLDKAAGYTDNNVAIELYR
jgi:hypothetical protein